MCGHSQHAFRATGRGHEPTRVGAGSQRCQQRLVAGPVGRRPRHCRGVRATGLQLPRDRRIRTGSAAQRQRRAQVAPADRTRRRRLPVRPARALHDLRRPSQPVQRPTSVNFPASPPAIVGSTCSAKTSSTTSASTRAAPNCSSRSLPSEENALPSPSPPMRRSRNRTRRSKTPRSPPPSLIGSPSAHTSSRPAPTPTGFDSPRLRTKVNHRTNPDRKVGPATLTKPEPNHIIIPISGTIHLIATDPLFNTGRGFHATPDSLATGLLCCR